MSNNLEKPASPRETFEKSEKSIAQRREEIAEAAVAGDFEKVATLAKEMKGMEATKGEMIDSSRGEALEDSQKIDKADRLAKLAEAQKLDAENSKREAAAILEKLNGGNTESPSTEKTEAVGVETDKEKPMKKSLEPGDEIYSDGKFYKVYQIHPPESWEKGKEEREREWGEIVHRLSFDADRTLEREKFDEKKKAELESKGRGLTALLEGSDGLFEFNENEISRVETPEQRKKIVEMQKQEATAERKAAGYMGLGAMKETVDKITGQPGKF
jgi:hypothetical protein